MKSLVTNFRDAPKEVKAAVLSMSALFGLIIYTVGSALAGLHLHYYQELVSGAPYWLDNYILNNNQAHTVHQVFYCLGLVMMLLSVNSGYDSPKWMTFIKTVMTAWLAAELVFFFKAAQSDDISLLPGTMVALHTLSVLLLFRISTPAKAAADNS